MSEGAATESAEWPTQRTWKYAAGDAKERVNGGALKNEKGYDSPMPIQKLGNGTDARIVYFAHSHDICTTTTT